MLLLYKVYGLCTATQRRRQPLVRIFERLPKTDKPLRT